MGRFNGFDLRAYAEPQLRHHKRIICGLMYISSRQLKQVQRAVVGD